MMKQFYVLFQLKLTQIVFTLFAEVMEQGTSSAIVQRKFSVERKPLQEEILHWRELVPQITASRDFRLSKETPQSAKTLSSLYSSNTEVFGIGFCKGTHLEDLGTLNAIIK